MNCSLNFLEMCLIRCFVVRDVCWSSESSWQFVSPHWRTGTFSWENNDGGHSSLWPHEEMRGFTCQHFLGNDCHDGGGKLLRLAVIFFFLILFCARPCTEQIPHSEWACRVARGQCGTGNVKSIVTAPKKEALHIEKIESSWGRCVTMNLQWTVTCVSKIVNCHCKYTHIQCICASVCPSYSFLLWVRVVLFLSSKKS